MAVLLNIFTVLLIWFSGTAIFSFINVVIYRVPRNLSFVKGYSFCPGCCRRLLARDLIPVISWLRLGGCCRYCRNRIPARDTWIEILGGCLALLCVYKSGYTAAAVTELVFLAILTAVAFVDWDTMQIPDGFVWSLLIVGLISFVTIRDQAFSGRLIGMVAVSLPLLLITVVVPGAFGGGDIKLMAACGLSLGWRLSLLSLFFAIITGGSYGIYLLAGRRKGRKDHFAFGPFLCIGMLLSLFWGEEVIRWYVQMYRL